MPVLTFGQAMRQFAFLIAQKKKAGPDGPAFWGKAPGDDLLLHGLSHTTIGACAFHFRVRNGIGWDHTAIVTRERVEGRSARCIELRARSRWFA